MEIGVLGDHGQAAQRAVVVASKLVLDDAIILLQIMVGDIAVAVMRRVVTAVHKLVQVITIVNCHFTIYVDQFVNHLWILKNNTAKNVVLTNFPLHCVHSPLHHGAPASPYCTRGTAQTCPYCTMMYITTLECNQGPQSTLLCLKQHGSPLP